MIKIDAAESSTYSFESQHQGRHLALNTHVSSLARFDVVSTTTFPSYVTTDGCANSATSMTLAQGMIMSSMSSTALQ